MHSLPLLLKVAERFGTPCFVYFLDEVARRVNLLQTAFGERFQLSYAVKSNPNPAILERMRALVDNLDISSAGELRLALAGGWAPSRIGFTGPGKRLGELKTAIEHGLGEVIIESLDEAEDLNAIAKDMGRQQSILVRISPRKIPKGFGVNMAGKPSQFGIDEESLDAALEKIKSLQHLELKGFHIYSGTQCLDAVSIAENYEIFIDVFGRATRAHDITPQRLVFGAGLGIPYYEGNKAVDLQEVAKRINPALDALRSEPRFADTDFVLELGRYLIGEAGIYVTRVIRIKDSREISIAICDGGMNHHLGACGHLGSVLHRNYRIFKLSDSGQEPSYSYELVGPLCTTIDTLGHNIKLPMLKAGDLIGIHCSGAYGITASPLHFISHDPPKEVLVDTLADGSNLEDVSQFSPRVI